MDRRIRIASSTYCKKNRIKYSNFIESLIADKLKDLGLDRSEERQKLYDSLDELIAVRGVSEADDLLQDGIRAAFENKEEISL